MTTRSGTTARLVITGFLTVLTAEFASQALLHAQAPAGAQAPASALPPAAIAQTPGTSPSAAPGPAAAPAAPQDVLSDARELYDAAAYDEALAALKMAKERGGPDVDRLADEYSAFCLLALGRQTEAEAAAESAIRQNPLALLALTDASPRVEELFRKVRRRVLPDLIREEYAAAREAMTGPDKAAGTEKLRRVRQLLDAAGAVGAWDSTLNDMSVLVDGFLELDRARAAAAPPATAPPAAVSPATATAAAAAPPRPAPARTIFGANDTDVTPPAPIRQEIPQITLDSPTRDTRTSGVLAVTIDERGNVQDVTMRESISATIDAQLVKAAHSWQYKPALRNGTPVRYMKFIGISIDK